MLCYQAKSGETGVEASDAVNDVKPPRVMSAKQIVAENGDAENGNATNGNKEETAKEVGSSTKKLFLKIPYRSQKNHSA